MCSLNEDLKDHKSVFSSVPRFTLSQYVTRQMLINTIEPDEALRRTPDVVQQVLRRLEVLFESKTISAQKILASFYDLETLEYFDEPWSSKHEKSLASTKSIINKGEFDVSKQRDTRILCQTVLDFLEGMTDPAISETTVSRLSKLTSSGMNSAEVISNQLGMDQKNLDPSLVASYHRES